MVKITPRGVAMAIAVPLGLIGVVSAFLILIDIFLWWVADLVGLTYPFPFLLEQVNGITLGLVPFMFYFVMFSFEWIYNHTFGWIVTGSVKETPYDPPSVGWYSEPVMAALMIPSFFKKGRNALSVKEELNSLEYLKH